MHRRCFLTSASAIAVAALPPALAAQPHAATAADEAARRRRRICAEFASGEIMIRDGVILAASEYDAEFHHYAQRFAPMVER